MEQHYAMPRDKAELLERIGWSRAALEGAIDRLSETQLTAPRDQQGWSVKDHLAHLAAWERSLAYLLRGRPRHEGLGVDEAAYLEDDEDGLNAVIHEHNQARPLPEVLVAFRQSHEQVLDALAGLTDADLLKTYSHYLPDEPGQDSGEPILKRIVGNTEEHYAEHRRWIEALAG